jgi:hypothetical protein
MTYKSESISQKRQPIYLSKNSYWSKTFWLCKKCFTPRSGVSNRRIVYAGEKPFECHM